jgi:hypothetical protein
MVVPEFIRKVLTPFFHKFIALADIEGKILLLFIGSPRTGSTLLGQILNYHPECLVANEARFITKVVVQGLPFEKALKNVEETALKQFEKGLEKDSKYGKTIDRYQSKWLPFGDLSKGPEFKKKEIKVVGDKKAGGATQAFIDKPDEMLKFLTAHPKASLLQTIRNPVDAAVSYMKSHEVKPFEKACEEIIMKTHTAYVLGKHVSNPYFYVYYEDLINDPEREIGKILTWLNINCSNSWLSKISSRINRYEPKNHLMEYYQIAQNLIEKYDANEEFKKYRIMSCVGKQMGGEINDTKQNPFGLSSN